MSGQIPGQDFILQDRKMFTTNIRIYNKCNGHRGSTGKFVVEIHNRGPKTFAARVMLYPGNNIKYIFEPNNGAYFSLKPGEKSNSYLELRGCLPKGRKDMDDLQKCAACEPKLVFFDLHIL